MIIFYMTKHVAKNAVLHNFGYDGSMRDWAVVKCAVASVFHGADVSMSPV